MNFINLFVICSTQDIYPERMFKTYVINAPMIFTGMWRIIKSFLDPVVASKVNAHSIVIYPTSNALTNAFDHSPQYTFQ